MEEYEGYKREEKEKEETVWREKQDTLRKEDLNRQHAKKLDVDDFILIKFQDGPIKEVGVNGAQVDDVLLVCLEKIQGFNGNFPCTENTYAIQHLQEALFWLRERKENRVKRGVEGFNRL